MHLGRISQTYKRSSVVISRLKWALCCDRKSLNSPQRPKALKPRPRGTITNAGQGSTNGIRSETNVRCKTTMFAGLLMVPFRLSRKKKTHLMRCKGLLKCSYIPPEQHRRCFSCTLNQKTHQLRPETDFYMA